MIITAAQASRDLAAKTLGAEERKYQLGAGTIFFVLDAQNQLSSAELALVQSQIAYQRALAEVDHASGSLLAKHNGPSFPPGFMLILLRLTAQKAFGRSTPIKPLQPRL